MLGLRFQSRRSVIKADDRQIRTYREPFCPRELRYKHLHSRALRHVAKPLRRQRRVQRHISAAGFQYGEQPRHQLRAAVQANADRRIRPDAERLQPMRQPVGLPIQFPVRNRLPAEHKRRPLRRPGRLPLEPLADRPCRRVRQRRLAGNALKLPLFSFRQHIDIGEPQHLPRNDALQHTDVMLRHLPDRFRLEQLRRKFPGAGKSCLVRRHA
ncbi:hypothetical protein Elgi_47370 [Paenibacillus elgii]|nr:hypothetical protein Elgi_47370 [Paenibacillus elgii]